MPGLLLNIDVPDLERGIAFYTAAFGLSVGRRFDDDFAELLGLEAPLYLLVKPAGSGAVLGSDVARSYRRHWTPIHPDIVVDDLDAAIARAVAAGATVEVPPREAPYGRLTGLADPFGHGFCLIAFNDRGYDALLPPVSS